MNIIYREFVCKYISWMSTVLTITNPEDCLGMWSNIPDTPCDTPWMSESIYMSLGKTRFNFQDSITLTTTYSSHLYFTCSIESGGYLSIIRLLYRRPHLPQFHPRELDLFSQYQIWPSPSGVVFINPVCSSPLGVQDTINRKWILDNLDRVPFWPNNRSAHKSIYTNKSSHLRDNGLFLVPNDDPSCLWTLWDPTLICSYLHTI